MNFDLTPEHQRIRAEVRRFAEQEIAPRARHVDETGEFPAATLRKMAELGLMGLPFPEEYGGAGADSISTAIAIEEVARACGSTALIYSAHLGLGCAPIAMFGTEEQKRRFLRPAAEGRHLGAFALTEPHAGSDAGATRTTARLENGEWVINGAKMWITSASVAGHLIVTAVTDPGERHSISAIIVPAGTPGLSFGKPEAKMGLRGSITNAVTFEDVRVPEENLLGRRGRGLQQFLAVLDGGRIGIGAMAIGLAQAAFEIASAYARERTAFGKLIGAYESVSNMIADMAVGPNCNASEVGEKICRDAISGARRYGYSSEYPLERIYRDQRLLTIGEGTSEILRVVIARQILGEFVGR
jgi:alkylation response protein AidB-like acyl-CoA dehydrogenase